MESTTFKTNRLLLLLLITGLAATLLAWQQKQKSPQSPKISSLDTIPEKKTNKEHKVRNLDEALEDLDHVKIDIDIEKINAELAKIGPEVQKEIAKAMKEIDIKKIKAEVDASIAGIDWPKIKAEVDASIAKIDWDKMKIELDKVKEINFDKMNLDMKKMNIELKKIYPELEKVKIKIEKAKNELKEYKTFTDALEKDGLINKKEGYTIKHKNGELIINGKTQPSEVYNKYRNFLEKHKTLTIEKSDDDFNIDNDDE